MSSSAIRTTELTGKSVRRGRPPKKRGQNDGSYTQRSNGTWMGRITLPESGGRRETVYGKTREECAEKIAALVEDAKRGVVVRQKMTVGEWLTYWLENVAPSSATPRTRVGYKIYARVHLIPALGHIPLTKLAPPHLQKFIAAKRREKTKRGTPYSGTSINHMLTILGTALAEAQRQGLVGRNAATLVKKPRHERKEVSALTPVQAGQFLDAITGTRFEALFVLAISTGLRQGEILALRWQDVDLDSGKLSVRQSVTRQVRDEATDRRFSFHQPKTKGSERRITLPPIAVAALRAHRAKQAEERLRATEWEDLDLVFPNSKGRPMEDHNLVKRHFKPALAAAKCPPIRFHDLRHSCATLLLSRRVHPKLVQELLGHSRIGITLDRYSHVIEGMHDEAAAVMDDILAGRASAR